MLTLDSFTENYTFAGDTATGAIVYHKKHGRAVLLSVHPDGTASLWLEVPTHNNSRLWDVMGTQHEWEVIHPSNGIALQLACEAVLKTVELHNPRLSQQAPSIKKEATTFDEWKAELIKVTAGAAGASEKSIKIKDEQAKEWFDSGATPWQCFRENWDNDSD